MARSSKTTSIPSSDSTASLDARSLLRATPVLLRLGVAAWLRATGRAAVVSVRVSGRVVRGAATGATPAELIQDVGDELRDYVKLIIGVGDGAEATGRGSMQAQESGNGIEAVDSHRTVEELRDLGEELLDHSTDVSVDVDAHPAYEHILCELHPDEARLLRFLAERGPQPSVDVRTGGTLGVGKSRLVSPGINLLALEAGCQDPDRNHQYLNNLHRLGLVWFSREELEDINRYQVVEAQPEVGEAMENAGRGSQTVRRSIHLTPFGADFCKTCLPLENQQIDTLPREID
jgi:hypothetical protein